MAKNTNFLSWLAGFIDADGSFVFWCSPFDKDGVECLRFGPVISIKQKHTEGTESLLNLIVENTGVGKIYYVKPRKNASAQLTWQTTNMNDTLALATMIYPYLILKKERCEKLMRGAYLLLEWQDGYNGNADRLWELYNIYNTINPDSNWSKRRRQYTREDIENLAQAQAGVIGGRYRKLKITRNYLASLPDDVLKRIVAREGESVSME